MAAIWHSAFILAAVTAFYDEQRKCNPELCRYSEVADESECSDFPEFSIYPDFFVFHVGLKPDDYGMFDIWPMHKCLYVEDDPEQIARAVNDRAISILLLSHPRASEGELEVQTRNSALSRIHHAFSASPEGPPEGAITIGGNAVVEENVVAVVSRAEALSESEKEFLLSRRRKAINGTSAIEHYCRISVEAALSCL